MFDLGRLSAIGDPFQIHEARYKIKTLVTFKTIREFETPHLFDLERLSAICDTFQNRGTRDKR